MTKETSPQLNRKADLDFNKGLQGASALRPAKGQTEKKPQPQPSQKGKK